ncbi:PRC-barrel domain-containing protein [Janibacter sp. GS2]|uniref:PRC-barrel domain-containing protein n=1 Tax=Janibacter sp. GS2 TaxID=3442646 RepID=UPI003EBF332E
MDTSDAAICAYLGRRVRSSTGGVLGRVDDVLADASSRVPQWLVVRVSGPLPRHRALPLALLLEMKQGLVAPVSRRTLGRAPTIALGAHLTATQELALRQYWMDQ